MRRLLLILTVFTVSITKGLAQDVVTKADDDTVTISDERLLMVSDSILKASEKPKRDWSKWRPNPKKATWLAFIPGAGQIYNRKYWKLPIVYGGFMGCIYAWRWNGQMYNDYMQAYKDITDDDPNTKSYEDFLHLGSQITPENIGHYQQLFQKRKDRYRRYRDLSIFCLIGVYAISIIDAYVDASLSEFDISDDLTLHVKPTLLNSNGNSYNINPLKSTALGINCSLDF